MEADEKKMEYVLSFICWCIYCSRIQGGLGNVKCSHKIVKNNTEEEIWEKLREKFTTEEAFTSYKSKFENAEYSIFSKTNGP